MNAKMQFECTENQVREILEDAQGSLISCIFGKRTGAKELRKMVCRLGVRKGVTNKGAPYNPKDYDLISVYDVEKKGFRMINLRALLQFQYNKVLYIVQHEEK